MKRKMKAMSCVQPNVGIRDSIFKGMLGQESPRKVMTTAPMARLPLGDQPRTLHRWRFLHQQQSDAAGPRVLENAALEGTKL